VSAAVEMYLHQYEWENADRVARKHDPTALPLVYERQGNEAQENKQYQVHTHTQIDRERERERENEKREANIKWVRVIVTIGIVVVALLLRTDAVL